MTKELLRHYIESLKGIKTKLHADLNGMNSAIEAFIRNLHEIESMLSYIDTLVDGIEAMTKDAPDQEQIPLSELEGKVIVIRRTAENKDGIFGTIIDVTDEGLVPFALTLENNDHKIPTGDHKCKRTTYYKKGYATFEVFVEGRTRILVHIGNTEDDSLGCILIGEQYESLMKNKKKKWAIWQSAKGFKEFMQRLNGVEEFTLRVEKKYKEEEVL